MLKLICNKCNTENYSSRFDVGDVCLHCKEELTNIDEAAPPDEDHENKYIKATISKVYDITAQLRVTQNPGSARELMAKENVLISLLNDFRIVDGI